MTAPRKLQGIVLKPQIKFAQQKRKAVAIPEPTQVLFDVLRQVVEEHRDVLEHRSAR